VSGVTTLYGQALTDPNRTARIKSWCVSIDGSRLTTNAAIYESVGYTRNDLNFAADTRGGRKQPGNGQSRQRRPDQEE